MNKPTENPTPRELYYDVCAAYALASRLTTTRICAPETYKQRSWFIWKTLYNVIEFIRPFKDQAMEELSHERNQ